MHKHTPDTSPRAFSSNTRALLNLTSATLVFAVGAVLDFFAYRWGILLVSSMVSIMQQPLLAYFSLKSLQRTLSAQKLKYLLVAILADLFPLGSRLGGGRGG
jgi:hypothetical protein